VSLLSVVDSHYASVVNEKTLVGSADSLFVEDDDIVRCNYAVGYDAIEPTSYGGPLIVDTGCPLSAGTEALRVDCEARGLDFHRLMRALQPCSKMFTFGDTIITALGKAPFWYDAPGGICYSSSRYIVPNKSVPHLMGMDTIDELGAIINSTERAMTCRRWKGPDSQPAVLPLLLVSGHLQLQPVQCRSLCDYSVSTDFRHGPPHRS
jgi:hypothetical protein